MKILFHQVVPYDNKRLWYKCGKKKDGKGECEKTQITKQVLEDLVIKIIVEKVLIPKTINQIAKDIVAKNNELNDHTKLDNLERELKAVASKLDNLIEMVASGIKSDTTKDKILEYESRKAELQFEIAEEKLNIPITLTEDMILFWLESFVSGDINDPDFRERLIDCFVCKIILYNDKIIIVFNIKGRDNKKTHY
ncbi:MAG: hypothetical protein LBN07_01550 [Christensenellaceae bacterium]|nr:hypothetical protein [Christensenellaceae bacterium]